jgi:hypothetical protein
MTKEEKRLYDIEYCKKNRDKRNSKSKSYYQENKTKYSNYLKEYYIKNKKQLSEYKKQYQTLNKEKIKMYCMENADRKKAYVVKYKATRKEQFKDYTLIKAYGIKSKEYNKLLEKQNGCCAICKKPQESFKRMLSVDHDHTTGKIRGLLCYRCNSALGFLCDSVDMLNVAIKYLESSKT